MSFLYFGKYVWKKIVLKSVNPFSNNFYSLLRKKNNALIVFNVIFIVKNHLGVTFSVTCVMFSVSVTRMTFSMRHDA